MRSIEHTNKSKSIQFHKCMNFYTLFLNFIEKKNYLENKRMKNYLMQNKKKFLFNQNLNNLVGEKIIELKTFKKEKEKSKLALKYKALEEQKKKYILKLHFFEKFKNLNNLEKKNLNIKKPKKITNNPKLKLIRDNVKKDFNMNKEKSRSLKKKEFIQRKNVKSKFFNSNQKKDSPKELKKPKKITVKKSLIKEMKGKSSLKRSSINISKKINYNRLRKNCSDINNNNINFIFRDKIKKPNISNEISVLRKFSKPKYDFSKKNNNIINKENNNSIIKKNIGIGKFQKDLVKIIIKKLIKKVVFKHKFEKPNQKIIVESEFIKNDVKINSNKIINLEYNNESLKEITFNKTNKSNQIIDLSISTVLHQKNENYSSRNTSTIKSSLKKLNENLNYEIFLKELYSLKNMDNFENKIKLKTSIKKNQNLIKRMKTRLKKSVEKSLNSYSSSYLNKISSSSFSEEKPHKIRKTNFFKISFSNINEFMKSNYSTVSDFYYNCNYFLNDKVNFKKGILEDLKKEIFENVSEKYSLISCMNYSEKITRLHTKEINTYYISNSNLKSLLFQDLIDSASNLSKLEFFFYNNKLTAFKFDYKNSKNDILAGGVHGKIYEYNPIVINIEKNDSLETIYFNMREKSICLIKIISINGSIYKAGNTNFCEDFEIDDFITFNIENNVLSVESCFEDGLIRSIHFKYLKK